MSAAERTPLELAILISGRGSNMIAIARACEEGRIRARVATVIADRDSAQGLSLARSLGLAVRAVASQAADGQEAFERALEAVLAPRPPDLIALAGFMRVLSAPFVARYTGRMLNIHPSLLPRYKGLHTHRRVLQAGERVHGASVHFVTAEVDGGPVVLQSRIPILAGEREADLAARVLATEHLIYPQALAWLAEGRLALRAGEAWLDGEPLRAPVIQEPCGPCE